MSRSFCFSLLCIIGTRFNIPINFWISYFIFVTRIKVYGEMKFGMDTKV